jgi:hypothetical protein
MRNIYILLLALICQSTFAQLKINIQSLGAVGDSITINTSIIQKAIDSCSSNGGGEVIISNGIYLTSTIRLKSNVTLRINADATLLAPTANSSYPDIAYNTPSWSDTYTKKSLIFAEGASNIRITGGGTIKCRGLNFGYLSTTKNLRPFGVRIHACTNVKIDSVKFETSPQWMLHIMESNGVHIHHINIYNHGLGSNDGIDIDGGSNILIEDCNIDSNDDPIVIKTHSEVPCQNVLVQNCTIATFERAVKVGNESLGLMKNITFRNIVVNKSAFNINFLPQTGIYLAVADGGAADSIVFDNIKFNTPYQTPIFVRLCKRNLDYRNNPPTKPVQYLRNVIIKNVLAESASTFPCSITGIPNFLVENILLENIAIKAPGRGKLYNITLPELETQRPENDIWGDSLPAYGMYVRHAKNITFNCFVVNNDSADARPKYYFEDTSAIKTLNENCTAYTLINDNRSSKVDAFVKQIGDHLFVQNNSQAELRITITDVSGRIVFVTTHQQSDELIEIRNLPSFEGIYFIELRSTTARKVLKWFK